MDFKGLPVLVTKLYLMILACQSYCILPLAGEHVSGTSTTTTTMQSGAPFVEMKDTGTTKSPGALIYARRGSRSLRKRYVETLVVVDSTMVDYYGSKHVTKYALTVMNLVSNIFRDRTLGYSVNIVVVRILIVDKVTNDSFHVSHSAKESLLSFCSWQRRQNPLEDSDPFHHDVAILFTRKNICAMGNFPCATIGMAMQRGMCNAAHSCSIVEDTGLNTAFTVAQMLGHNFGLIDSEKTSCHKNGEPYIMSSKRMHNQRAIRFQWSQCSREMLGRFLKSRTAQCLLDEPSHGDARLNYPVKLPGQTFSLDAQCKIIFGNNSSFCKYTLALVCKSLWCLRTDLRSGCTTNRQPAAEGTACGKSKWCIGGLCVMKAAKPNPVDGQWGSWSGWSSCTRTCGGGVTTSKRACDNPRPTRNGKLCTEGKRIRHRICNTELCPETGKSFRDVQCGEYNKKPYRGRFYEWTAVHLKAKECGSLICKAKGFHFYVSMARNVKAGSPCRSESYDRCIGGICRTVGCDYKLGSKLQDDICGKCGGNGTSCRIITNVFRKRHGMGYVTVAYIPKGSTSIAVREERPSRNYIALLTSSGENILNGGYMIERPGMYFKLGKMIEYKKRGSLEAIWIKGPISQDIKIMILFQADAAAVWYQFASPSGANQQLQKLPDFYLWKQALNGTSLQWNPCSATCGKGQQHAKFDCMNVIRGIIVEDKICRNTRKPSLMRECIHLPVCPIAKIPTKWKHGKWTTCSATCGVGTKTRIVQCIMEETGTIIQQSLCESRKPRSRKRCHSQKCSTKVVQGLWIFGAWGPCSRSCGNGTQQRVVRCVSLKGEILDESKCRIHRKPTVTGECGRPCVRWIAGEWGKCSSKCGGKQRRCVMCIDSETYLVTKKCSLDEKPGEERTCNTDQCRDQS